MTVRARSLTAMVGRRLTALPLMALGVATLVFAVVQLLPGRPLAELAASAVDPAAIDHLRNLLGTDRPMWERYLAWLGDLARGDLGFSTIYRRPVGAVVVDALGNSVRLAGLALVLQFSLGVLAGSAACLKPDGPLDRAVRYVSALFYATPGFVVGLLSIGVFSVWLGWLPASQMQSIDAARMTLWESLVDRGRHLVLPAAALALPGAAGIALYVREELRGVLEKRFLATARAIGGGRRQVVLRHGVRNALLPAIQLLGLSLPGLVGGSVVIETLFAWPGVGRLAYEATMARDEAVILACTLFAAAAVVVGSLVADVLAVWVDPRVRDVGR